MILGQGIRSGVQWLFFGNTGGQILQFAFGIVLARVLVPADFGMVVTMQVFTGFVGLLASGGMGQSLVRAKEATDEDFRAVFTMQLALGVGIYATFFFSAPLIARYLENPLYEGLLRVSALSFLLRPFSNIHLSWLSREMLFKKITQVNLMIGVVTGVASVAMATAGFGVWSLILSGLLGAVAGNVAYALTTPIRLRVRFDMNRVRAHGGYGLKFTTAEFLKHLREQGINLIISKMAGPAAIGLFSRAESLARMAHRMVTPATSKVVFRAMSKVQDDLDQTKYMFHRMITLLMVYILPFVIGLGWTAEQLVAILYGEKWLPIVDPMRIIMIGAVFRIVFIACSLVLQAQDRLTQEVIAEGVTLVLGLAACVIGLRWGLNGVAWGVVLTSGFFTVYVYVLVHRILPIRLAELLKAMEPAYLLNGLLFVTLAAVHFVVGDALRGRPIAYLAIMVPIGGAVYTIAFLYLPIPELEAEANRWRQKARSLLVAAAAFRGRT